MTRRRRKNQKKALLGALCTLGLMALLVLAEPVLADYGISLDQVFSSTQLSGEELSGEIVPAGPAEGTLEVHFLDVGQGSSILILGPEKTALIDAGERSAAPDILEDLAAAGVEELDYFFITHPHSDHFGGALDILEEVPVERLLFAPLPDDLVPTTATYEKLLTYLTDEDCTVETVATAPRDQFDLGGGASVTILGPLMDYKDLNNMSMVLRLDFGETSFLFPGDAEEESEGDLAASGLPLKADVLAAPHHGSRTSLEDDFMFAVNPSWAVISCGLDNDYGHPNEETLALYEEMGISYFRTDEQGTIVAVTDGSDITFTTGK